MKYTPLDELLALPRVRILRALRRADWVDAVDLYDACLVSDDPVERNSFSCSLSTARQRGEVERRTQRTWSPGHAHHTGVGQYRITERGRTKLDQVLAKAQPSAEDFEDRADVDALVQSGQVKCKRCPYAAAGGKHCHRCTKKIRDDKRARRAQNNDHEQRLGEGVAA